MQGDFHYYATYCAAILVGYSHEESLEIAYSCFMVDHCTRTFLSKVNGPQDAATTQLQLEMVDARTDMIGIHDITRIWSSFHFLPKDLYADKPKRTKRYMQKYRLICGPNGDLVEKTVKNAKDKSLQHIGIAMHVLADTWAHAYFAGTPSLVINNIDDEFYEIVVEDGKEVEKKIKFKHNPASPDDVENRSFTNTIYQGGETNIMNLGHGRAGHLPDYSYLKYRYVPAWDDYRTIIKDNPHDYVKAFTQVVYGLRYLKGDIDDFKLDTYDEVVLERYSDRINSIITKRQTIASDDWKAFGEELSGQVIEDFDLTKYQEEYINASIDDKDNTFIGKFTKAAISQKGLVTSEIQKSGNKLAGKSKRKH